MRKPKTTPEEKLFIKNLKALAKTCPKSLCLMTTHHDELWIMKKWDENSTRRRDNFSESDQVATIKIEAHEDIGYW